MKKLEDVGAEISLKPGWWVVHHDEATGQIHAASFVTDPEEAITELELIEESLGMDNDEVAALIDEA
jgi:hypothetical protein